MLFRKTKIALSALASAALLSVGTLPAIAEPVQIETRSLEALYQDAIPEDGKLVVWAGGDADSQFDGLRQGFASQFPEIDLEVVVDVSKFFGARVDN